MDRDNTNNVQTKYFADLLQWYDAKCDGEWEQTNGISIETLDNPGILLTITDADTEFAIKSLTISRSVSSTGHPENQTDWYDISATNQTVTVACSVQNFSFCVAHLLKHLRD